MRGSRRLAIALVVLAATGGLCVVEASTDEQRWPYAAQEAVVDGQAGPGERALLFGTVRASPARATAFTVEDDGRERTLSVRGADPGLHPGGTVQVFGTLRPGDEIDADRVVAVNRTPAAELRKWVLSAGAVCLFVVLFHREWRVDLRRLRVEVREDG